jgi:hypothetical protein
MSVHRKYISKVNQQDATFSRSIYFYKFLYIFQNGSSAHHQEHKTVHTASGIVKPILLPAAIVDEMEVCMYSFVLLMMGGETA